MPDQASVRVVRPSPGEVPRTVTIDGTEVQHAVGVRAEGRGDGVVLVTVQFFTTDYVEYVQEVGRALRRS